MKKIQKSPGAQHCAVPEPFGPHKGGCTSSDPVDRKDLRRSNQFILSLPSMSVKMRHFGISYGQDQAEINRSRWAGVLGDDYTNIDKHSPGRSWLRNCAKFLFSDAIYFDTNSTSDFLFQQAFWVDRSAWRLGLLNDWVSTFNHWRWKYIRKEAHSLAQLLSI